MLTKGEVRWLIESEPEFDGNIWKVLGFWKALGTTLVMVLRPYHSARTAARATKINLLRRLDKIGGK